MSEQDFLKILKAGWEDNRIYVLHDGNDAIIIDPCEDYQKFIKCLEEVGCENLRILLTHGHEDHISAIPGLMKRYPGAKILITQEDHPFLTDPVLNGSSDTRNPINLKDFLPSVEIIKAGESIEIGSHKLEIFATPGHTEGSVIFIDDDDKCAYTGDTLFCGTIGATHFPGGDPGEMMKSLIKICQRLPDDYKIYPGHSESSTMAKEKKGNVYIIDAAKMA